MKRKGFTLLETLLALMVFSMAVVALVEAVHQLGAHTLLRRHEAAVQERMRSLLVEHTRRPDNIEEVTLQDGEVSYTVTHTPLELKDRDGQTLAGMFEVRVTAAWKDGQTPQQASAETWVYPPLFRR
ncbi:MAG: prepilin-type N-terminal cleavage/methylation domain-containing protein [Prosthecobacter sp.]|uniref:type II secretion system protein n=1 Tax=Prosthecobacter sp. TaxID=1965333 RepID=UPI0026102656|nr:prepilin-type N-terminal cleavage/methylation domain-containing protein [Prosthecobacter sp.]MCF7790202.1 prepilin-type N-terminal cleavage/methylation domain-containing protein [Prosthecobacter sp.]